jgi:Mg2+ and Co2+ transporter CorA
LDISTYRLSPEGLESLAQDDLIAGWRSGDGAYWLDASGASDEWRKKMLTQIGVSDFVEKAVLRHPDVAGVVSTGDAVFFRIPAIVPDKDSDLVYLNGLIVANLLVTWRDSPVEGLDDLVDALESPTDMPWVTTTSDLVAALCVTLSSDASSAARELRHQIDSLDDESRLHGEIDDDKLNAADSRLHIIDEMAGDYSQVFPMLRDSDSKVIDFKGHHSRLELAVNNAHALTRRVRLYYQRLAQLHQTQVRFASDKTNRRLGVLSVLSAIFLPLTLLTGIFGMNFEYMPGLSFRWAYPALLILMVSIAVGLWRYFKRSGWI